MPTLLDNPLQQQVCSVPQLLRDQYKAMEPLCRTLLDTPTIYSVKKIILTGSGDCYAAALAVKPLFEKLLRIPVEAVDPLALSREYQMKWVGESPCDPLVIAMSSSGRASRVVEAVQRLRKHKALTVAITSGVDSPLAEAAQKVLPLSIPPFASSPGARSYGVMVLVCQLLAIRFGEVRLQYPVDAANQWRKQLLCLADELEARLPAWCDTAAQAAEYWQKSVSMEAVGSGYQKGSAFYAHAKAYEAAGIAATYTDSEHWFHLHYFLRNIGDTLPLVFAGKDEPAASRTRELVLRMGEMKRAFVLVTDQKDLSGTFTFLMDESSLGYLSPLVEWAPAALIASGLAQLSGEVYGRGFEGIWNEAGAVASTTRSETLLLD